MIDDKVDIPDATGSVISTTFSNIRSCTKSKYSNDFRYRFHFPVKRKNGNKTYTYYTWFTPVGLEELRSLQFDSKVERFLYD